MRHQRLNRCSSLQAIIQVISALIVSEIRKSLVASLLTRTLALRPKLEAAFLTSKRYHTNGLSAACGMTSKAASYLRPGSGF